MKLKEKPLAMDFEIINISPIDDYISECEIKVFYHGKNRNRSYISKAVGNQIANSLPRTPIVAFYNEKIEDFEDHGEEIVINKDGVKFTKKTVPYGAVSEFSPIVWKKFIDDFGKEEEYMVAKGYLWTGRYPFLESVLENSKGQSMEFFEESVIGNWARFDNEDDELFIYNEANVSALCILGDDVEPCFEGASVGKPETKFSLIKDDFKQEFDSFMFELSKTLDFKSKEGGVELDKVKLATDAVKAAEKSKAKEDITKARKLIGEVEEADKKEALTARLDKIEVKKDSGEGDKKFTEDPVAEPTIEEPVIVEPEPIIEDPIVEPVVEDPIVEDPVVELEGETLEDLKTKYSLVEKELEDLKASFSILVEEKKERENLEKREVCEKFSVLGEDVISKFEAKLDDFTAEELEKEFSVLAFQKGITFDLISKKEGVVTPVPAKDFSMSPAWLQAVEKKESAQ